MAKNKTQKPAVASSVNDIIEWFDRTDIGDHLRQMPQVNFDVEIKRRRHLVSLDPDLSAKVSKIARAKKISSESLISSWVREKVS